MNSMRFAIPVLLALPGSLCRLPAQCCGGGSTAGNSTGGGAPNSLSIIYTDASTNIGTSPAVGLQLNTVEYPHTDSDDKPQGGNGLMALLTDPVTGARPGNSPVVKHWVVGGTGNPLQKGSVEAVLRLEASSSDVYHPLELSYVGSGSGDDFRDHFVFTPPAGHYLITSTVSRDTTGGWSSYHNNVVLDPEHSSSNATFLRVAFVSERGDPHHEPGDFTFPALEQDENMTDNSTLGSVVSGFTRWLGNDLDATDARKGRSWGKLVASPGLLVDVGAHQLRFITSHSKVDDGGSPLVDEIINASSRIYQIKTAAVVLDVRETVHNNNSTPTDYSDDLRKVVIRITTTSAAGTPDGNGIYPLTTAPVYGTLKFKQTERNSNGFTFKTVFTQHAPGVDGTADGATAIAEVTYSAEEITANQIRKFTINRKDIDTEVIENKRFSTSNYWSATIRREWKRATRTPATPLAAVCSTPASGHGS